MMAVSNGQNGNKKKFFLFFLIFFNLFCAYYLRLTLVMKQMRRTFLNKQNIIWLGNILPNNLKIPIALLLFPFYRKNIVERLVISLITDYIYSLYSILKKKLLNFKLKKT
jgi:hypothetical protein